MCLMVTWVLVFLNTNTPFRLVIQHFSSPLNKKSLYLLNHHDIASDILARDSHSNPVVTIG